jgi:HlyD family secretion protein
MERRGASRPALGLTGSRVGLSLIGLALLLFLLWRMGSLENLAARQQGIPGTGQKVTATTVPLGEVHALARLEPASGLILVGARPGARIEQILVAQGDQVSPGQVLAVIEGHDQAQAQLALAQAQKAQVEHQRSLRKQKLALEREQFDKLQQVKLDSARRVAIISKQQFDDSADVYKKLGAALQGKDRFETDLRYFESEAQNVKAELDKKSLEIAQDLTPKQRELEDKELADSSPDLEVLDRQIDLAEVSLAQTLVKAPIGGHVLELLAHAGEVSSGPLLDLADVSAMVATAEVYQSDVPRVKLGDAASVQILGQVVTGKVTRIGTIVGKNMLTSLDPRALQDRRVVKVAISLDDSRLAARLVNLEVDVGIKPGGVARAGDEVPPKSAVP